MFTLSGFSGLKKIKSNVANPAFVDTSNVANLVFVVVIGHIFD
jgi:hypothetical protein